MEIGLRFGEAKAIEKGKGKMSVVNMKPLTEAELAETMRRQILSWPSKVSVDEVGVTLLVGLCQILEQAYGQSFGDHFMRLSDAAKARFWGGGDGPTHKMSVAA